MTHDQIEAMTLASRIVVLKGGYVQQIGTPQEIYEHPANTFVADFMGSPPMNLCPAIIEGDAVRMGQHLVQMDAGFGADLPRDVIFGVRPEHLVLSDTPDLLVTPTMIENTGSECYVLFEIGDRSLTAKLPGRMDETNLDRIGLAIDRSKVSLFDAATTDRIAR